MKRTLFIPALDAAEAKVIAAAVVRGETSELGYHTDHSEVERICAHLNRNRSVGERYQAFEVEVRETTTQDGRILVAWAADKVGDVAATLTLFAYGAVVAAASLWEHFA